MQSFRKVWIWKSVDTTKIFGHVEKEQIELKYIKGRERKRRLGRPRTRRHKAEEICGSKPRKETFLEEGRDWRLSFVDPHRNVTPAWRRGLLKGCLLHDCQSPYSSSVGRESDCSNSWLLWLSLAPCMRLRPLPSTSLPIHYLTSPQHAIVWSLKSVYCSHRAFAFDHTCFKQTTCTLIYYTIHIFTLKSVQHVSVPYFGTIFRDPYFNFGGWVPDDGPKIRNRNMLDWFYCKQLYCIINKSRSQSKAWVYGRSLLGLWVRIPPGAWMSVCCECCVLSGRGLCDGLITRLEESYGVWCV
jgi:hypothetical protein